jgi:polysaccharide export outer membrane protein
VKSSANYPIKAGLLLIAFCISALGQVSASGGNAQIATATASPAQLPPASEAGPHNDRFVIGNDDVLAINVWKEPDFTQSAQVRSDGKISLPLVGEIQAAGRTPLQLEQDITARLLNYLTKPEVTVMVEKINSEKFNILGQVTKPGSYSLSLAPTVVDAIAMADGFRDFAKQKSIYILRKNPTGGETRIPFNYKNFIKGKNLQQNVKLEPHDTIVVP